MEEEEERGLENVPGAPDAAPAMGVVLCRLGLRLSDWWIFEFPYEDVCLREEALPLPLVDVLPAE